MARFWATLNVRACQANEPMLEYWSVKSAGPWRVRRAVGPGQQVMYRVSRLTILGVSMTHQTLTAPGLTCDCPHPLRSPQSQSTIRPFFATQHLTGSGCSSSPGHLGRCAHRIRGRLWCAFSHFMVSTRIAWPGHRRSTASFVRAERAGDRRCVARKKVSAQSVDRGGDCRRAH